MRVSASKLESLTEIVNHSELCRRKRCAFNRERETCEEKRRALSNAHRKWGRYINDSCVCWRHIIKCAKLKMKI